MPPKKASASESLAETDDTPAEEPAWLGAIMESISCIPTISEKVNCIPNIEKSLDDIYSRLDEISKAVSHESEKSAELDARISEVENENDIQNMKSQLLYMEYQSRRNLFSMVLLIERMRVGRILSRLLRTFFRMT